MTRLAWLLLLGAPACLGPRVSDVVKNDKDILPAGSVVPSLYDDADDGPLIEANDQVGPVVPLLSGFVDGKPVRFWDFGPAPDFAQPFYVLTRGGKPIGHPAVVTAVPGDPGYSPFWALYTAEVTAKYNGELLTSVPAVQYAVDAGLIEKPALQPIEVNCPIVYQGVQLEVGDGKPNKAADGAFYYEGKIGYYFSFGTTPLVDGIHLTVADVLVLRREGGEPLSEPLRGVDMDGDGDTRDTNDLFAAANGDAAYTPLVSVVNVTVPADTKSIDTTQDQTKADLQSAGDLFSSGAPVAGKVIAVQRTGELRNMPLQKVAP